MAEEVKRVVDSNGRRVETRTYETIVDGKKQRITETHVEDIPMVLAERIVEDIAPVVTTRKKEVFKDGKVVDTSVEALDHGSSSVSDALAQPVQNFLTKDDLLSVLKEVLAKKDQISAVVNEVEEKLPIIKPVVEKVKEEVAKVVLPVGLTKAWDWAETGMYALLSGQLAFCLYHLFLKNWL